MGADNSLPGEPVRRPVIALVVDAVHPWSRGGREIRYHELTRRLADRAEYHVYTMHWWDGPRVRQVGDVTFHAISPLFPMYHRGRRSLRQSLFFPACCLRLLWRRFDILESDHIPHLQVLVLCLVAAIRRKPFIVTWHEVWGRSGWQDYLGRWLGPLAWLIEWVAMRLPDRILAASDQTEEALRAIIGPRMPVDGGVEWGRPRGHCCDHPGPSSNGPRGRGSADAAQAGGHAASRGGPAACRRPPGNVSGHWRRPRACGFA